MSNNNDFTISINVPPVIDYFEEARDEYFRVRFLDYPKEVFESFAISITIGSTAKNGYLVYAIIDALPQDAYSTFKNVVSIYLTSEDAFAEHYETILDLLSVVKTWKSTSISYNEIEIDFLGFRYLGSHILGRKNAKDYFNIKNITAIRQKYVVKKRIAKERKKDIPIAQIGIRSSDRERILFLVLKRYVELYCKGISFEKHQISAYETVLYKDYQVIYQYRPYYLSTEGGTMSYDIYICGLKVAIEYQGQQHFEPVDYFGGAENHERQKQRDALKAERSKENGVHLVYVYYWESITPELIKNKVEQSLQDD